MKVGGGDVSVSVGGDTSEVREATPTCTIITFRGEVSKH